jgi:hypothetical protein
MEKHSYNGGIKSLNVRAEHFGIKPIRYQLARQFAHGLHRSTQWIIGPTDCAFLKYTWPFIRDIFANFDSVMHGNLSIESKKKRTAAISYTLFDRFYRQDAEGVLVREKILHGGLQGEEVVFFVNEGPFPVNTKGESAYQAAILFVRENGDIEVSARARRLRSYY